MKKFLRFIFLLTALLAPAIANSSVQLADGVYQDGSTLYIGSSVTSLGNLYVNPSIIYCYALIPPSCLPNTFSGYNATLHVPTSAMASYFSAQYWYNFSNVVADAIEPQGLSLNKESLELEVGDEFTLTANVSPNDATFSKVNWSSTNTAVATVSDGLVSTLAPGECDIIANCYAMEVRCHLVVTPVRITIKLYLHEASILPNHMLTLKNTFFPTTTDLVAYSSDNDVAIPRIVNGEAQVLGLKEGTAIITLGSADGTAYTDSCVVTVYTEYGDVDGDGYVNISDVTGLIDLLLSGNSAGYNTAKADTDRDGRVNISDVTTLIDHLLGGIDINPPIKETFIVNGVSFNMIQVPLGTFWMGSYSGHYWEQPAHEVTLSSYSIGETEVTQALWVAVMGSNPSKFKGDLNRPVEQVSWDACQTFIEKLNELTGKNFRLPTEAEWENAARGGNRSQGYKYSGSNDIDEVAWYWQDLPSQTEGAIGCSTQPVATKKANELGIFDMSGNVQEWCQDWFDHYYYSSSLPVNPTGPESGTNKVIRGGNWGNWWGTDAYELQGAFNCQVIIRMGYQPSTASSGIGFRLAL